MRGNNVLGIIFSNMHEELIREITDNRTMGSVPFGGRYRLIDFTLSNMVNSGINKVGVITKVNYQSLMDHLGSGKSWDLSRRRDGLFILPPFGNNTEKFTNRIKTLSAISGFLNNSKEEYVLLSDCDVICNIDYLDVIKSHIKYNADITIIYKKGIIPEKAHEPVVLSVDKNSKVDEIFIDPQLQKECNFSINMFLLKKHLLIRLLAECMSKNEVNFKRDLLQKNVKRYNIFGYEFTGFSKIITSMNSYFEANMTLMSKFSRTQLFCNNRPIYTKVRDDMPGRYGTHAKVKNSSIANGCIIEGEIENSVLFRGVNVGKGSKVSNCVLMQDTFVGENCNLNYVISDKDVVIKNDRILMGFKSYPVYISKASVV